MSTLLDCNKPCELVKKTGHETGLSSIANDSKVFQRVFLRLIDEVKGNHLMSL